MTILNSYQQRILTKIQSDPFFKETFYFTGGTALAEAYLKHRYSDDLDFFSPQAFNSQGIFNRISSWADELGYSIQHEFLEPNHMYFLTFKDEFKLKLDFAHYPFTQLERPPLMNKALRVDSLRDISANKLITITQRNEIKDYVDLYFIFQNHSFWNIRTDCFEKFKTEIDPYLFASDILQVMEFDYLPKMIEPLSLQKLKTFYTELAKTLGKKSLA